jgi:hypothetical protein
MAGYRKGGGQITMIRWSSAREEPDLAVARQAIATFFAGQAQRWADGQSAADPIRARLMDALRLSFSSGAWTLAEPDVEGARAAMVTDWQAKQEDVVSDWLVPLWVTTRGVMFALSALLHAAALRMQWHVVAGKEAGWYLAHKAPDFGPTIDPLRGWGALRDELGRTDWASYQKAVRDERRTGTASSPRMTWFAPSTGIGFLSRTAR